MNRYLCLTVLVSACALSCADNSNETSTFQPKEHLTGVPALSGKLANSRFTMASVIEVDLDRNIARLPLFKGSFMGDSVWYVRTDVSDSKIASELGLNFAPRLANGDNGCPACIQNVVSVDPVLGNAPVEFAGTVDFSPMRTLVPSSTGFPPLMAQPGSVAKPGYSDLVRVGDSAVVFNAPIIATGDGPFDVTEAHMNTLDRVMAIDIEKMTVDLQFIRAFSHGKEVFYLTFGSTGALSATLERATFTPGLATVPFANDDENPGGARSSIFTFTNGKQGKGDPNSQGLMHVIRDNAPGNLSLDNPALLESLRDLGDAHNVLGSFPTLSDARLRGLYSPLWDLNIGVWSEEAVDKGVNFAQTDANTIRQLAAAGYITNQGGGKLGSSNFVVNCPVLGFATSAPTEDQAGRPIQ